MNNDFEIQNATTTFDFKGFLLKVLSYWYVFVICIAIGLGIAYYKNVRKLPVYRLKSLISIKDDQNPIFTSNTSLTFNWGGTSDKVNTALTTLKTRSHAEKVVNRLQYYIHYLRDGEYQKVDAYAQTPFKVEIDTLASQILNHSIQLKFIDSTTFQLTSNFAQPGQHKLMNYLKLQSTSIFIEQQQFQQEYKLDEKIILPFFSGKITASDNPMVLNKPYYFSFLNFDSVVKSYQGLNVNPNDKGSSVLQLSLTGNNKAKIVDFLNTTVQVLREDMLHRKNLFATKTIRFIDSSLQAKSNELKDVENELNQFKRKNSIFDITEESSNLREQLSVLDIDEKEVVRQLEYYNSLQKYLQSRSDYTEVPAPTVAGIEEPSIATGVSKIISLSETRSKYKYSLKKDNPAFADIDRNIDAAKTVLLENINSSKNLLDRRLKRIRGAISKLESKVRSLPKEQQDLLKIQRRYNISEQTYNLFMLKRNEAGLVRASNVSDVMVIDEAKDVGGGQIGPNTRLNYILAVLIGGFVPLLVVFILVFIDNRIHSAKDVERLSPIPVLGMIGKSKQKSSLVVFNQPKSAIAESFRGLRTSLQFIYKREGIAGCRTVLLTSSISGEGKTFCAMNLASVFSISGKKTILIGLDLRRPRIFDDFEISNDLGIVNYLIQEKSIPEIIQKTRFENLEVITSGAIPPNPSELLMNGQMDKLIETLREEYDYIILDTPPIGLVADALNLGKYADATLYVVRQNYTRQGMLNMINEKYHKAEVENVSFLLNYFQQKAKYGNSYGYGYSYGYGVYGKKYHEAEVKEPWYKRWKSE